MIKSTQEKESGPWSSDLSHTSNASDVTASGAHSSVNGAPRIAVFVSGGGTNLQALIDAVGGYGDHRLNAVIALVMADRPGCYALERAAKHGIQAALIDRKAGTAEAREQQILALLEEVRADYIVLAGFLGILGAGIIEKYRDRIVNVHPSLIPKYCGKGFYGHHVHEAVLAAGDTETGVTVHLVDEGVDTGRILMQRKVPVLPGDTPETLYARLQPVEHKTLVEAVGQLIAENFGRSEA
ncbi:phosphoribosylglycinamide formyltransferase [Acidaminobacter hydrogenoformans]|uniref:Phosphoribosylglycinamide formyltransferase n=1 Tax=Acidaminobacter hydrogenoformans DSM 2784 TaxID=1120920 RepID=A0A1G5RZF2_9FIRM|nr:phosphoribosylglycinamide formyltransferase [Acidaminobacter hydrogenoformans]SCZ78699.1 formyltetrahydrofolate-dependent phosphoribosylglycinamide formyltransferase [Acidaminobacter hydrogenoformans DSM 2784]